MSSDAAASTIGLVQLALQLPRMATEIPSLARGALGLTRKPDARESIGRVFQDLARRQPDRPFIRFDGASISYRQANERVNRYADVLVQQGVERGDVVGILMKNRPETLLLTLAAVKLGAVAGMLNHNQRGEVLAHSLSLLDSRVLVVGEECDEAISSLSGAPDADTVLSAGKLDELAESADPSNPAVCEQIQAKERAFYIFTSGTTGMPKASLMSHFRWLKSMSGLGAMGVRLRRNDTLYCALPLYHNNALTVSLSSVLSSGATFAIARTFSASRFGTTRSSTVPPRSSTSARCAATCSTNPSDRRTAATGFGSWWATGSGRRSGPSSPSASGSTASPSSTAPANATSRSSMRSASSAPPASALCRTRWSSTTRTPGGHDVRGTGGCAASVSARWACCCPRSPTGRPSTATPTPRPPKASSSETLQGRRLLVRHR